VSKTTYPNDLALDGDVEEKPPLSSEHAELFLALDRLLTIGSYYTPEHARYQEVAREAHAAIRNNLGGSSVLEIECTHEGFWVHDVFIENGQRETKRTFELLNNLSIGLLEIDSAASSDDLHVAVSSLKHHLVTNAGKKNFEEIAIEGLPDTIRTTSQSLYVKTRDRSGGPGGTRPRSASGDHYVIPDSNLVATPDGQKLEREFLGIISAIMHNGDPGKLEGLDRGEEMDEALRDWVPDSAVGTIKEIMGALKKTNSDPLILEHLIGHAQAALELTADPLLVELVFERLRKETGVKSEKSKSLLENRPKPKRPKKGPVRYTMTPEQMNGIIDELTEIAESPEDLLSPATADCLGICTQILCSAPTEHMILGIGTTIFKILSAETLLDDDLKVASASLAAILKTGSRDTIDGSLPLFLSPLRKFHSMHLGPVWLGVWKSLVEIDHKRLAWPHLVNELLLGVEWEDPGARLALYESLTKVNVGDGEEMLERLEDLQALRTKTMAPEVFHAPAPLLYPVHVVLLASTVSRDHGPKLHERLVHQRAQRLSNLLVGIMGCYKQSNKMIYQAILDQGVSEMMSPKLKDIGSRLLVSSIRNLLPEERDDLWVAEALTWLGKLDPKRARPILTRVAKEKKFFLFPVWPAECRQAARAGLSMKQETPREEETGALFDNGDNDER